MSAGKVAAMASHCSRLSLLMFLKHNPQMADKFLELNACGSMVVLKAKKESDIRKAQQLALEENLPVSEFSDSGHIHGSDFNGDPLFVGISIGPAYRNQISHITKKFRVWS